MKDSTSLPPRPLKPIVVPVDEITHKPPYYFCHDASCNLCHNDPELIAILQAMVDAREVTPARALEIYWDMS